MTTIHPTVRSFDDPAMGFEAHPCFYWRQTLLYGTGYAARSSGSVDRFSASLHRNLCPGRASVFVPEVPSEGHRVYL